MTQHERQLVAAAEVPALDGEILPPNASTPADPDEKLPFPPLAKAIPDSIEAIDPNWDVAQIASRGHVLVARSQAISNAMNLPMTLLLFWCVTSIVGSYVHPTIMGIIGIGILVVMTLLSREVFIPRHIRGLIFLLFLFMGLASLGKLPLGAINRGGGALPESVRSLFVYDPDTYFDLGGGLNGGPDMAWMGDYKPQPESLSAADYDALVKAVQADVGTHGKDAASWTAVQGLKTQPMITRPAKALPKYGDRLKDGIVLIPEEFGPVSILAHTQGQWSINLIASGGCATVLGPIASGCQNGTTQDDPLNVNVRRFLAEVEPKQAAEE